MISVDKSMDNAVQIQSYLYLLLKYHSSPGVFFTYFANQLPGFYIGGPFGLRLVKIQIPSGILHFPE